MTALDMHGFTKRGIGYERPIARGYIWRVVRFADGFRVRVENPDGDIVTDEFCSSREGAFRLADFMQPAIRDAIEDGAEPVGVPP